MITLLIWIVAFSALTMRYRHVFTANRPEIFAIVAAFFAGSLFFDRRLFYQHFGGWFQNVDDAAKMFGIYGWLTWVVLAALAVLRQAQPPPMSSRLTDEVNLAGHMDERG